MNETKDPNQTIDKKRLSELGTKYINDLTEINIKNAEAFDRAILTLSTGSLSLSVLFLDKIIDYKTAILMWVIFCSWIGFTLAIILNVLSLFIAQREVEKLKIWAEKFYFSFDEEYGFKLNRFKSICIFLNIASGISYVVSISLTIFFVIKNLT